MDITRAIGILDWLNGDEWLPLTPEQVEEEKWEAMQAVEESGLLATLPGRYGRVIHALWNED